MRVPPNMFRPIVGFSTAAFGYEQEETE